MFGHLLRPRWLALHLGVAALVVLMVNLGFWQLRRLDERRDFNREVSSRTERAPVPLADVPLDGADSDSSAEWSVVTASGVYIGSEAVTVVNRSQNGAAGVMSVVPLLVAPGEIVLVNRGFVPLGTEVPDAPAGRVDIVAYLRQPQTRSGVAPADTDDPSNTEFQRYDVELIAASIDPVARDGADVLPLYLQLAAENPDDGNDLPDPATMPVLDEGPHLSYAVQWYFFSLCALAGWGTVVGREIRDARRRTRSAASA